MPTPSEQKALAFVAIVVLLGGAVRVLRAGSASQPTPLEQQALARQAAAADSATATARKGKSSRRGRSAASRRDTLPHVVGGVASVPPTYARPDRPFDHTPYGGTSARPGFPAPSPRIDTPAPGVAQAPTSLPATKAGKPVPAAPVDLDAATAEQIATLPRIGPSMARRLVANRDSLGPFGSIQALRRVKGMGAATLEHLAPLVSFGGRAAPPARAR